MTTAPLHYRCTLTGTLGSGTPAPEIFSFGFGIRPKTSALATRAELTTLAGVIAQDRAPFFAALMRPWARIKRVRVACLSPDVVPGKLLTPRDESGAYLQGDANFDLPGTSSTAGDNPPQIAVAVSLLSSFAGPSGRGRFYLPAPAAGMDTATLTIAAAARNNMEATVAAQLTALNVVLDASEKFGRVCVASRGNLGQGILPGNREVTHVAIGPVFDTQRRRRNALVDVDITPTAL